MINMAEARRAVKTRAVMLLDGLAARISRHEDFVHTFESPQAKKVLAFLFRKYNVLGSTFVAGDPYKSAYLEGQRSVVIAIAREVNLDQAKLIAQIEEAASNENTT